MSSVLKSLKGSVKLGLPVAMLGLVLVMGAECDVLQ